MKNNDILKSISYKLYYVKLGILKRIMYLFLIRITMNLQKHPITDFRALTT